MRLVCCAENIKRPSQALGAGVAATGLSFYTGHLMLLARLIVEMTRMLHADNRMCLLPAHALSADSCCELLGRLPSFFSGHLRTGRLT